jgi:hypothetical protein
LNNISSADRKPEIGYWWCFCCECDLYEIRSQDDIDEVNSTREYHNSRVWETEEAALLELGLSL